MVAFFYFFLIFFIGYQIVRKLYGGLFGQNKLKCFTSTPVKLPNRLVTLPASFLVGTLIITWITYLISYAFKSSDRPLYYGNIITITLFTAISVAIIVRNLKDYINSIDGLVNRFRKNGLKTVMPFIRSHLPELVLVGIVAVISIIMMTATFYVKDGALCIGNGVYGDFGPHLSVIRSFSLGSNFPTEYPHFSSGNTVQNDMRYHFMFQFFAGNLEYLGLRIDWAFNIPSILSMLAFVMLLYSLAIILTGSRAVGYLTVVFFYLRSSFAFFTYAFEKESFMSLIKDTLINSTYIGKTRNEWWGIWTQNVFVNQRHFAFSLAVLVLTIILLLPLMDKMVKALKRIKDMKPGTAKEYIRLWIGEFALKKDCWLPQDMARALSLGLLVGAISFWNGAVVFSLIPILFFMTIMSKHRLEYLIIAVLVALLAVLESSFFVGSAANVVNPRLVIGFLADIPKEIREAVDLTINSQQYLSLFKYIPSLIYYIGKYYIELLGIMPLIVAACMFISPKGMRWLTLCFITPAIMASMLGLTNDITVNHKFVNVSVFLLNILAAYFIVRIMQTKSIQSRVTAGVLIFLMTITGVVDAVSVYNLNTRNNAVVIEMDHPVIQWTLRETDPNAVFLTHPHIIHPILLSGRKLFLGSHAFPWSAGYDVTKRDSIVRQIYGGTDPDGVKELVEQNNISYIVIEGANKKTEKYNLNQVLINDLYGPPAYENNKLNIVIYKVK